MKLLPALLLAAGAFGGDPPAEEWERPWAGLLPDAEQGFRDDTKRGSEWLATRILDAETGRPIPGARLFRTPEWIAEAALRQDFVMSAGTADAEGVARVPALGHLFRQDCHWLAVAPGYAPVEDYGIVPKVEMRLRRGGPMALRVLDPLGRPVAGSVLEFLGGCSHGTAGARATAGADGVATFPNLSPDSGQFWVYGPGIESDLLPVREGKRLGTRPDDLVMDFGKRFEGRVVDLLGAPLPGCVVRIYNESRGPAAMTDRDGRFVLEGAGDSSLHFFPALDLQQDGQERWIDDAHPDVPFTVVVTSVGTLKPEESARVVVRARDPAGKPVDDVAFTLVDRATGRGPSGTTDDEESEDEGVDAAPGTYRVLPDDPFGAFTFDPVEVRVAAKGSAVATLTLRPRPHLRILGSVPPGADLVLAVDGETETDRKSSDAWSPPLPATGTAAVRVEIDDRPPFFFPVGPEKDGFREVTIAIPEPRRIPVPPGARNATLLSGGREVLQFEDGDALCTDAAGPLVLRWRDASKATREVAADRPGGAPRTVVTEVTVRALGPGEDGKETALEEEDTEPGDMVVLKREGWRTLRVVAPDHDLDLRWGNATLRLTLAGVDGEPADALVLVDGEIYAAPDGKLELRGLDAGPHRVVAAPRDRDDGGRELLLVLKAGETRERKVTLGLE